MSSDFESYVASRLEHLEARHRRLKRFSIALLLLILVQAVVVLYLLLPVGSWLGLPRTVEASRFVLVDEQGRMRAELVEDQGPKLELLTADGSPRAILWVNHDGAASVMLLDNKKGTGRLAILSARDDGTSLGMTDDKVVRARLEVSEDELGLRTFDEQGKPVPTKGKPLE